MQPIAAHTVKVRKCRVLHEWTARGHNTNLIAIRSFSSTRCSYSGTRARIPKHCFPIEHILCHSPLLIFSFILHSTADAGSLKNGIKNRVSCALAGQSILNLINTFASNISICSIVHQFTNEFWFNHFFFLFGLVFRNGGFDAPTN